MPYILRNAEKKIVRADVRSIPGGEMVAHDHPDLVAFLKDRGQDPAQVDEILANLRRTDQEMSRAIEDVIMALVQKNVLKMSDMPAEVQDRIAFRVRLRVEIQEIYARASESG